MTVDPAGVFVVVPAYNEGPAVRAAVEPLLKRGYQVVVVDDGSTDATWQALDGLPVYRLRHPINLGQGAALQTGTEFAVRQGASYVVHFDADGQHQADDVPGLLAPLAAGAADVALGSRFLRPEHARMVPRGRRWLLRCGILFHGLLTGLWLSDAHNGLRAMTRQAAAALRLRENRQAHASEILLWIRRGGWRWVESPTAVRYHAYARKKGQSAVNALVIGMDLLWRRLWK
jgi:glycosyltransferase involved in cell wall biosynthesis